MQCSLAGKLTGCEAFGRIQAQFLKAAPPEPGPVPTGISRRGSEQMGIRKRIVV